MIDRARERRIDGQFTGGIESNPITRLAERRIQLNQADYFATNVFCGISSLI